MIKDLYTERLHLRKMTIADSSSLFKIWADPEVTQFMNIQHFTNEDEAKEMITYLEKLSQDNQAVRFSIVEVLSNEIIGSCGYNSLDFDNAKTEIGYDIARMHWGNGYATEAVSALIDYSFNALNFNRVEAKVEPQNVNSIKVLKKLGFTFEGTLRQCEKVKDKFVDLNLYSKLKSD
ncbi:GNAT family protein [Pseudobacillus sp. FSL P4-0506]|uniref:GNAT family N-acetyltransferase n=1 Tax=unclassified Pseudobacillus TaxID=2619284 RepID=UPI0030F9479A